MSEIRMLLAEYCLSLALTIAPRDHPNSRELAEMLREYAKKRVQDLQD